jgi:hypothetical protein
MANNPDNLIFGGGYFKFNTILPGANPNLPASYAIDFGNCKELVLKTEAETKEHYGTYAGVLKRDRVIRTKKKMTYEAVLDEFGAAVWDKLLGAATGAAPDPAKTFTGFGFVGVEQDGEPLTVGGSGIYVHHSFKCQISMDGELKFNGDDIAECKLKIEVDLGTPGLTVRAARPVV